MNRLLIASNRLPFTIERNGDQLNLRQSAGGLVSAIKSYFEKSGSNKYEFDEKIWFGSVDFSPQDFEEARNQMTGSDFNVEPVYIDEAVYNNYYNGFSNSSIWPLFHYFPSLVEYKKEYFDSYKQANQLFAEKILSIAQDGDVIWVHDYQLMLLPQLIRRKKPNAIIGFFLHIPFPSYELLRLLPNEWRISLLSGILGADLVGFHTYEYVQHFIQSAKMIIRIDNQFNFLQYKNRLVKADLFPIGIDYQKFHNNEEEKLQEITEKIRNSYGDKKIIFSVDRQDYTKGLMYRLQAFDEFLTTFPEWKEKLVFMLNIIPSRTSIPAYSDRKQMLEQLISTINGKHSTLDWQPLIYRYNHIELDELKALYKAADIALITPLRDGMNLVAKEYVASRSNQEGVLILSELTGAANELNEALLVNPTDSEEVARTIQQALTMPVSEQQNRMVMMQKRLKDYDVVKWMTDFLDQLQIVKKEQEKLRVKILDKINTQKIAYAYGEAGKRLILLDYDGTLVGFTRLPSQARPGDKLIALLEELTADKKNDVVIISGRDERTLSTWLGHLNVTMVAEHGASVKWKGENWEKQIAIHPEWKEQIRPVMQTFVSRCAGSMVEEKENTLVWHYRNTQPDLGFTRSRELLNTLLQLISNTSLQVIDGNKVLEVRQSGIDKGSVAMKLVHIINPDFVLCIGDDTTDEDMFNALSRDAITIKVGNGSTAAHFTLLNQDEVYPLLQTIMHGKSELEQNEIPNFSGANSKDPNK